ncbi:hypothetical protein [Mycolicibacter icosiumassiliensis]|nr:hypothetical protein [Mycolicibacter icosiumassiliensis]
MSNQRISAALDELEAERSAAVDEILKLERRRENRLADLKRLVS